MICERFIFNIQGFLYFQIKLIISNVSVTCCGRKSKDKVRKGDYKWIVILVIVAISANINQDGPSHFMLQSMFLNTPLFTSLSLNWKWWQSQIFSEVICIWLPGRVCCNNSKGKLFPVRFGLWWKRICCLYLSAASSLVLSTCSWPRHIPWASCHLTGLDLQLTNQKSTVKQSEHTCRLASEKWYGKGRGGVQLRGCILSRRRKNCWMV